MLGLLTLLSKEKIVKFESLLKFCVWENTIFMKINSRNFVQGNLNVVFRKIVYSARDSVDTKVSSNFNNSAHMSTFRLNYNRHDFMKLHCLLSRLAILVSGTGVSC